MAKNVVVMGATSGIGEALARSMSKAGCDVALAGRRTERLEAVKAGLEENGGRVVTREIDVTSPDAAERLGGLVEELGGVDLYIHASGIGRENSGLDPEIEVRTVETNATGFVRCAGKIVSIMREAGRGGHIVAISSVVGMKGLGVTPAYSSSKAFMSNYLQSLRQLSRAKGWGITVTDIRPGFVDTEFLRGQRYPMTIPLEKAAAAMTRAILDKRTIVWIDWRYLLLGFLMWIIPDCLWTRLSVGMGRAPGNPPVDGIPTLAEENDAEDGADEEQDKKEAR